MSDEPNSNTPGVRVGYVHVGVIASPLAELMEQARTAMGPHMAEVQAQREAEEAQARAEEAARALQAAKSRLRQAGIPEDHEALLLTGLDLDRPLIRKAHVWREDASKRILVIGGNVGVGKTLAACWLLAQGPRRPYRNPDGSDSSWPTELHPRFIHATELARLDTYRDRELGLLVACSVLVVDEIGGGDVGSTTSWAERLEMLVTRRYDDGRDTILTTNLRRQDLQRELGARTLDRLNGRGMWIDAAGRSMRQEQPAEHQPPHQPTQPSRTRMP